MKRDPRLVKLSWDHHHGLVMSLRIERELPGASADAVDGLYSDLLAFWSAGLLPHFHVEGDCLLARLLHHRPADDPVVSTTLNDHLDMASLVAAMRDTGDVEQRRGLLERFGRRLREHIRWEEDTLFPAVEAELTEPEFDALGRDIEAAIPGPVPAPARKDQA